MTENDDGTFSSDYIVNGIGTVTVSVELATEGGVYAEYFLNNAWSGVPAASQIESEINHQWNGDVNPLTESDNVSAQWYGKLYVPTADDYIFTTVLDDGG